MGLNILLFIMLSWIIQLLIKVTISPTFRSNIKVQSYIKNT